MHHRVKYCASFFTKDEWIMVNDPITKRKSMMLLRSAVDRQPAVKDNKARGRKRPDITVRARLASELGRKPTEAEMKVAMNGDYLAAARSLNSETQIATGLSNHISYAAGHCQAWLEVYAASQNLSARQLTDPVGRLLQHGGK
jgi:hypothetical protein